jgi:hypothetical protein
LAPAETFHFAVRISRGAATRLFGTLQLAKIIGRAIPHAALDVPILTSHRAASRFGAKHLAVLIRCALPFSAHYIPLRVLDAIRGIDLGAGGQGYNATNKNERTRGKVRHGLLPIV